MMSTFCAVIRSTGFNRSFVIRTRYVRAPTGTQSWGLLLEGENNIRAVVLYDQSVCCQDSCSAVLKLGYGGLNYVRPRDLLRPRTISSVCT